MDLKTYIKVSNMTYEQFAKKIGVTVTSISNYINFRRKPNAEIIRKIELETKREVTVHDLLGYWEAKKDHG